METLLTLARDPSAWAALATLVAMEIVLGIDNLIFISILTNKLPEHQRESARRIGIGMALFLRIALLGTIAWIIKLTAPVFAGDTIYARTKVIAKRESQSRPKEGIVTTYTEGYKSDGTVFVSFERMSLIPKRAYAPQD